MTAPVEDYRIPVTVFTGFLGAGKTTVILSLLPQLPKDYKIVLLKNEFGSQEVDKQLAIQSSLTAVSEIVNGCMCCVLVGQMKTALLEIKRDPSTLSILLMLALMSIDRTIPPRSYYHRVVVRTGIFPGGITYQDQLPPSGSAFPATLALQINQLESEGFKLDAIVTVIDAENFIGYEDKSITAKMQAQYTDIILLNKWENVSERHLDLVIDHLNDLNDETPRLKCSGKKGVPPSLIFGLDSTLRLHGDISNGESDHHDEVESHTVSRGPELLSSGFRHKHSHSHPGSTPNVSDEIPSSPLHRETLDAALAALSKESIWRVKGYIRFADESQGWVLNWAFGRYDLIPLSNSADGDKGQGQVQLTIMGAKGSVKSSLSSFAGAVGAKVS